MARPLRTRPATNRRRLRVQEPAHSHAAASGHDDADVVARPRTQSLPVEVARQAQREMDRLRRLPAGAPETAQVRAYLQWLWSLPWDNSAPEDADSPNAETSLRREPLGLSNADARILEYLAVRCRHPHLPGPVTCLAGRP